MLLDGCGSIVRNPSSLLYTLDESHLIHSTGACCIVRTVLNYESVARDSTCELILLIIVICEAKPVLDGGIDNWFWRLYAQP